MGVSFRKPEDKYQVDLKARIDNLDNKIKELENNASSEEINKLRTRIDRIVISNAFSYTELAKKVEAFEAEVLRFLETLKLSDNDKKKIKNIGTIKF